MQQRGGRAVLTLCPVLGAALFGSAFWAPADGAQASERSGTDGAALITASCSGCHIRAEGLASAIPNLSSRTSDEIYEAMLAFQKDKPATLMNRIARGYTEAEIRQIADYLGRTGE